MKPLNEEISRLKEIMGLEEVPNGPADKGPEGYDDSCDCYPDDEDVTEGEIEEQDEGGESSSSSSTMSKWDSGVQRGKGNPIETGSKWESGLQRGKGNPIW
jgi:hypothetical protein